MNQVLQHSRHSLASRIFSAFLIFTFSLGVIIPPYVAEAQVIPMLPIPGTMVMQTPGYVPALIKGITIHPENPLAFDFIIDTGDSGIEVESQAFKDESMRLVKYFMASLTVPEDEMWVNLSPVEKDRIVPQSFGMTDMGMDLLAQDYILKQLTASLMYPEEELGKKFWDRVYERAQKEYGTTDIPMDSFHKVWILPKDALVYEKGNQAFVIRNELKVMMEEDYFALQNSRTQDTGHKTQEESSVGTGRDLSVLQTEIMREIILPEIEKEVNEGKNFAQLRQIFQSAVLATWFKQNLKQSLLGQVYVDQKKTKGIDIERPEVKEDIYQQYIKALEKGVYDYIREDYDPATEQLIPRHYFSGGTAVTPSLTTKTVKHNELSDSMKEVIRKFIEDYEGGKLVNTEVNLAENPEEAKKVVEVKKDEAMLTEEAVDKIVSELVSYNITAPSQQMKGEIMGKIRTLSRYLGELKANSDINSLNIAERLKNNESLMTFLSNFAEVSSRDVDERLSPKKDIYLFIVNIESLANLKNLTEQDSLYVGMSQEARKLAEPLIQSAVLSWNKYEGYVNQYFHVIHFTAQVLFETGLVPTLEQAKQMVETVFTSAYRFEQESWHYQAVKAMVSTSPFDQVVPDTTLKQFADSSTKELPEFFKRILDEWLEDTRNTGWSVEDTSHALYEEAKNAQEEGIVDPETMRGVYERDIVAILQVLKRVEVLEGSVVGDSAMLTLTDELYKSGYDLVKTWYIHEFDANPDFHVTWMLMDFYAKQFPEENITWEEMLEVVQQIKAPENQISDRTIKWAAVINSQEGPVVVPIINEHHKQFEIFLTGNRRDLHSMAFEVGEALSKIRRSGLKSNIEDRARILKFSIKNKLIKPYQWKFDMDTYTIEVLAVSDDLTEVTVKASKFMRTVKQMIPAVLFFSSIADLNEIYHKGGRSEQEAFDANFDLFLDQIIDIDTLQKVVDVIEDRDVVGEDAAMLANVTNVPTFIQQMDMWKIMRTKGAQNMLAEFANWAYETLIAKNENVPQLLDGTEDAETRNKKIGPNLAPFDAIESGLTIISNRNEKDRMEDLAKIPEGELTQGKLDELNKRYPTRLMDILENLIVQMKDMKEGGQAHQDLILLAEMANATWKARQTSERRERDVFRPWSLLSKEQIDKDFIFLDQFLPKVLEMLKQMRSEAYSPEVRKQFQQQINVMVDKAAEVMRKNGESFDARSLDAIRKTALGVMEMFSEKTRKDGVTPYFTHQLGMAMLALETFKFNDTVGSLIALLHHDTREDLPDMYDAYKNYIRGKIMLESDAVARDKRIAQVDSFLLEVKLLSKLDGDSDDVELIKKYFQQMEDPTNPAFNFAPREGQDWYTADFIHDIQAIKLIDILFNIGDLFNVFKDANLEAMNERTKGLPERSYKKLFIGIENLVIPSKFLSKGEKLKFLDGVITTIKGYTTAEEFKKAEYAPLIEASSQEVLDQLADYRNVVDQMVTEGTSAEQKDVSAQPARLFRKGAKLLSFDEFVRLGGLQAYSQGVTLIEVRPDGKGYFGIRVSGSAWLKELIDSGLVWVEQSKMASGRYTMDVYYEQNNAEKIQAVLNDLEGRQFPREISIDLPRITSESPLDLGRGQTLHSTEGMSPESKSALFERLKVLYNRNSDGYGVGYLNLSYHKNAEALYITENNEIAGFIVFELERGLGQRWNLTLQVTNYGNEGKGIGTKLALYMILTIKQRFPEAKITSTELTGSKRDLSKPVDTTDRQGTGYGLWKGLEEKTGYKFVVEKTDKSEPHVDGFLSSEDMREIDNIRAGNIKVSYLEFAPPSLFVIKTWIDKFAGDQAMLTDDGDGDFFKDLDPRIKEFFVSHGVLTLADFQAKWQELFEYLLKMSDQDGTREMIKGIGNILKQHDGLPAFDLLLEKDPSWNLLMNGKTLELATEFVGLDDIVAVSRGDNTEARLSYHFKQADFLSLNQNIFIDPVNQQIEAQFIAHIKDDLSFSELINASPNKIQISVTNLPLQIISEEKLLKGIRFTRENGIELLLSENAKELSRAVQIALLDGAPPIQVAMDFKKLVIDHARQVMAKQYGVDERQLIGDLPALLTNFLRLNLSAMEIKPEAIVESWAFGIMLQAIDLALTIKDPKDSTKNMFTRADFAGIDFDKIIRGAVEKDGQTVKSVDTVKLARPAEMVFLIVEKGLKGTLDRQGVSSFKQIKQLSRAMSMMGAAHISALVSHFFYGFEIVNSAVMAISGKIAALRKSKTGFGSEDFRSDDETSSPDQRSGDQAMLTRDGHKEVGGIDLNPEFLDLKIKRDGAGIPLPLPQQSIEQMMQIEGFLPVIINVTPISNLPMLLGMDVVPDDENGGNRLSQLDAMDKVAKLD